MTQSRLGGADGVRALACLMVMVHHACQRLALPMQDSDVQEWQLFFLTGAAGVGVFFVLSGYLLASPFWKAWAEDRQLPSLGDYAVRRWARIAPAFWLNLTLTFVLALTFVPDAPHQVWRYVSGLTFTSSLTWETLFPVEINGPLWSIGFEVFSYACLGLLALLWFRLPGKRSWAKGFGFWAVVLVSVLAIHGLLLVFAQTDTALKGWQFGMSGGAKYWWPQYNPVGFFGSFALGIVAAGVTVALRGRGNRLRWLYDAAVAAALALVVWMLWELRHEGDFAFSWPTQPYYFPSFALLFAVVLALGPHSLVAGRVLDNPVARFVATISFGLYIWHYLLLELARMTVWPEVAYFGIVDMGDWAFKIGVIYAAAAVLATLSWYGFEKRIVRWSQGVKSGVK